MACKLIIKDPLLKFFLGSEEFMNFDNFVDIFSAKAEKKGVFPLSVKVGKTTKTKFLKLDKNYEGNYSIIFPANLEQAFTQESSIEVNKLGTVSNRTVNVSNRQDLAALYLSGLIGQPTQLPTINKVVKEFVKQLETLDRDDTFAGLDFISSLTEFYKGYVSSNSLNNKETDKNISALEDAIRKVTPVEEYPTDEIPDETNDFLTLELTPAGYAYTVNNLYDGTTADERQKQGLPFVKSHEVDQFRHSVAAIVGKNPKDFTVKIQPDSAENVQTDSEFASHLGFILVLFKNGEQVYVKKGSTPENTKLTTNKAEAMEMGLNKSPNLTFFFPDFSTGKSYNDIDPNILPLLIEATDRNKLQNIAKTFPEFFNHEYPVSTIGVDSVLKYKKTHTLSNFLQGRKDVVMNVQTETSGRFRTGNVTITIDDVKIPTGRTILSEEYQERVISLVNYKYASLEEATRVRNYLNYLLDFKSGDVFFRVKEIGGEFIVQAIPKSSKQGSTFIRLDSKQRKPLTSPELKSQLGFARINVKKSWADFVDFNTEVGEQFDIKNGILVQSKLLYKGTYQFYLDHHVTNRVQTVDEKGKLSYRTGTNILFDVINPIVTVADRTKQEETKKKELLKQTLEEYLTPENLQSFFANADTNVKEVVKALILLVENKTLLNESLGEINLRFVEEGPLGNYDVATKTISVRSDLDPTLTTSVLAHEIIHAITEKFIKENPNDETVVKLRGLVDYVKEQGILGAYYENPYELLAVIANPDVAAELRNHKLPDSKKNLLEQILEYISDILKTVFKKNTKLKETLYGDLLVKMVTIATKKVEEVQTKKELPSSPDGITQRGTGTALEEFDQFGYSPDEMAAKNQVKKYLSNEENRNFARTIAKSIDAEFAKLLTAKGTFEEFISGTIRFSVAFDDIRNVLIAEKQRNDTNGLTTPALSKFYDFVLLDKNYDFVKFLWQAQSELVKVGKPKEGEVDKITPEESVLEATSDQVEETEGQQINKELTEAFEGNENAKGFERSGVDKSPLESADKKAKIFVRMLPRIERLSNGNPKIYSLEEVQSEVSGGVVKSSFISIRGTNTFLKTYTNELGRTELCDYYKTWNLISLYTLDSMSLEEIIAKIRSNPKVLNNVPEAIVFANRIESPEIKTFAQADLRTRIETSFKKFSLPLWVMIKDKLGNYLVRDESADIFEIVKNQVNTNFLVNVQKELSKYVLTSSGGVKTFNIKSYLADNGLTGATEEEILSSNFMEELGFTIQEATKNYTVNGVLTPSRYYTDFKIQLHKMLSAVDTIPMQIANWVTTDNEKINGINNYFKNIYRVDNENRPYVISPMVKNPEGENQSTRSVPNAILQDAKTINDSKTLKEFQGKLARAKNEVFKRSLLARIMFDEDGNKTNKTIQIINYAGSKSVASDSKSIGNTTINLNPKEKLIMDFVCMLKEGIFENTRAETASMSLAFKMNWGRTSLSQLTPFNYDNIIMKDGKLQIDGEVFNTWQDYLIGEMYRLRNVGAGQIAIFSFASPEFQKSVLDTALGNLDIEPFVESIQGQLKQELITLFNNEVKDLNETFSTFNVSVEDFNQDSQMKKMIETHGFDYLKMFYAINGMTMHLEEINLFHGDLATFGKFYKRAKSIQSTGVPQSTSETLITYINTQLAENSFSALEGTPMQVGLSYKTALIKDDVKAYPNQENLEEGFKESKQAFYDEIGQTIDSKKIEEESKAQLGAYAKTNIGDGDGAIHPDYYKALLMRVGNWPQERETVYQGLIEDWKRRTGKKFDQLKIDLALDLMEKGKGIMPKIKVTYRGNGTNGTENRAMEVMDKFALFPMFPQFVMDKPLGKHTLDTMTKNGIAYIKMDSGSKIDNFGKTDFIEEFENGNVDITLDDSMYSLEDDKLREQIQTPEKAKKENTFGSQFRKLIISTLKTINGAFLKLAGEEFAGQFVQEWESAVKGLSRYYEDEIVQDFKITKNEDGSWDFSKLDMPQVLKKLVKEIDKRDLPENLKVFFAKYQEGKEDAYKHFEESFSRAEIEKLLTSIIKKISVQKVNGAQLIQVASSLYNRPGERLKYYEYKNGKVSKAECKVSMTGDFKNLLNLKEVTQIIKETGVPDNILTRTEALNKLLLNEEFVEKYDKQLTIVAYRIPTQGFNSMDVLRVKEFIPSFNEMTLIPPPEITVKSGTDYDYDKMSVFLPTINENGNLTTSDDFRGYQNKLIDASSKILLDKVNFWRLITPNSDTLIMSILKDSKDGTKKGLLSELGYSTKEPFGSDVLKSKTNFLKWMAVKGKNLLGIVAVSNTFYTLMQRHNWKINPEYKITFIGGNALTLKTNPILLTDEQKENLLVEEGGIKRFNLSNPFNVDAELKSEIISQLINVTVDMPSDDAFGFSNFKRENFGASLYLSNAFGYSLPVLFKMFHQPVVFKYMSLFNKYKDTLDINGKLYSDRKAQMRAVAEILGDRWGTDFTKDGFEYETLGGMSMNKYEDYMWKYFDAQEPLGELGDVKPISEIGKLTKFEPKERGILAHYLKALQQSNFILQANSYLNVDTSIDNVLMKVYEREDLHADLKDMNLVDIKYIDEVRDDSVVSALNTGALMKGMSKEFFKVLYSDVVIQKIRNLAKDVFGRSAKEAVYSKATNDYLSAVIQNFGEFEGQPILDFAKTYIQGTGRSYLVMKANELKETYPNLRLLQTITSEEATSRDLTNTKLFLGFDNSPDDKNQLTDEFRYLLKQEDSKEFAAILAIVGVIQSGYQKSPLYFSDIIPEEFVTPILSKAFSKYKKLSEKEKQVFTHEFGKSFKQKEAALFNETGTKESWRFKDYEIDLEAAMNNTGVEREIRNETPVLVDNKIPVMDTISNIKEPVSTNTTGKKIVVPTGSKSTNLPIMETEDTIYLMNDGQQESYDYLKTFLLSKLKKRESYDIETSVDFTDPLSKPYSGIIPVNMWNSMIGLKGQGGTGKTTLIKKVINDVQEEYFKFGGRYSNLNITYAAPTHNAVTMLQEALDIDSEGIDGVKTTASLVKRNQAPGSDAAEKSKDPNEELALLKEESYKSALEMGFIEPISMADIIVIDEASMVSDSFINDLLFRFKSEQPANFPIFIFMGDYRQLPPISPNSAGTFSEGIVSATLFSDTHKDKSTELTQIMRSENQLFFDIFNSIGDQITEQRLDFNAGKNLKVFDNKKYDELTNQSTRNLLIVQEKQIPEMVKDYVEVLATSDNPYEMFWVHYNRLGNPKTQALYKTIREAYFNRIGVPIPADGLIGVGDYIESTMSLPFSTRADKKKGIVAGTIKPRARLKVKGIEEKQHKLRDILEGTPDLYYLPDVDINVRLVEVLNRQGRTRQVVVFEKGIVTKGQYDKISKTQEVFVKAADGEVITVRVPYPVVKSWGNLFDRFSKSFESLFQPSYIGSSHTVQGASIKKVIVGDYNVRQNAPNIPLRDMESSLYTSLTRTSEKLIIIKPNSIPITNNQEEFVLQEVKPKIIAKLPTSPRQIRTYSGLISNLKENQVFVFGSNPVGINGNPAKGTGGAALVATTNGWVEQSEKMDNRLSNSGKAWGLTTVSYPGKKRSKTFQEILEGIKKLYDYAKANPEKEFLVAYSGTGTNLNGYSNQELGAMFSRFPIPSNVVFEEQFATLLTPKREELSSVNIYFSSGENKELSNLAERPFVDPQDGRKYWSVEHAYQTWKSGEYNSTVYNKYTKGNQKISGGNLVKTENNWNLDKMKYFIKLSFEQNPIAKQQLLDTGNSILTHTQDNTIWKTEFPRILTEVRNELRKKEKIITTSTKSETTVDKSMSWGDLKNLPVYSGKGVMVMRKQGTNEHFGNPFTGSGVQGLIQTKDVASAVQAYKDWLTENYILVENSNGVVKEYQDINVEQREWILSQINQGKLDNQTLLYMNDKGEYYSHADALSEIVNNRNTQEEDTTECAPI